MKFKIGFTIEGETLFRMMAQFLPVEDMQVEEVFSHPAPNPLPSSDTYVSKLTGKTYYKNKALAKPRQKRRASRPVSLTTGINKIIIDELSHGMARRASDIKPAMIKAGYSANSVASRMQALLEHGVVEHMGDGAWRIADAFSHLIKK